MSLWLARHARPLVAPGICYGATDVAADADLTLQAAHALALALPRDLLVQVSPLGRCQQLGQALVALRGDLVLRTDARLREMDFGTWEGVAWSDIPRAAVDAWTADFAHHRFGSQESASEVLERVGQAWDALSPDTDTLWITHLGVAHAATLLQQGRRQIVHAADWPITLLGYGQWQCFQGRADSPASRSCEA